MKTIELHTFGGVVHKREGFFWVPATKDEICQEQENVIKREARWWALSVALALVAAVAAIIKNALS